MSNSLGNIYLESVIKRFGTYKDLGDKTFEQLTEDEFHYRPNEASNSVAVIIQHIAGNMLSRWTRFLEEDGEKTWRNRDAEFEEGKQSKEALIDYWEKGWNCLLGTLQSLKEEDLLKTIHIRNEPLVVIDAINRQLAHYPHHVGQIIYVGKIIKNESWKNLSIEKGKSQEFNDKMMK